jgi:hypothetical protein
MLLSTSWLQGAVLFSYAHEIAGKEWEVNMQGVKGIDTLPRWLGWLKWLGWWTVS